jgi:hypothetical protein
MGMLEDWRCVPSPAAAASAAALGRCGMLLRRLNCSEPLAGQEEGGAPAAAEEEEGGCEATGQPVEGGGGGGR